MGVDGVGEIVKKINDFYLFFFFFLTRWFGVGSRMDCY